MGGEYIAKAVAGKRVEMVMSGGGEGGWSRRVMRHDCKEDIRGLGWNGNFPDKINKPNTIFSHANLRIRL